MAHSNPLAHQKAKIEWLKNKPPFKSAEEANVALRKKFGGGLRYSLLESDLGLKRSGKAPKKRKSRLAKSRKKGEGFLVTYSPRAGEPEVYLCDSPEKAVETANWLMTDYGCSPNLITIAQVIPFVVSRVIQVDLLAGVE